MTLARQRLAWIGIPLLLVVQVALIAYDLTHSNRPHELRFVWPVLGLAAVAAWLTVQAWRGARARSPERLPARQVSGLVALSVLTLASLVLGLLGVMTVLSPLFG